MTYILWTLEHWQAIVIYWSLISVIATFCYVVFTDPQ